MLEYDFNELDNDFITLWSKFLLTNDKKAVVDGIEALAELGQINAVQSWYLVKQNQGNRNIDNIVRSYNGSNFNEFWAMANAINPQTTAKEIDELWDWVKKYCEEYLVSEEYVFNNNLTSNCDYFRYLSTAINLASNIKNNLYVDERVAEMLVSYHHVLPIPPDKRYIKLAKRVARDALKQMEYILNKQENVYEFLKNTPQLAFAVAKNHLFFSKKEKEIQFATDVLTDLSNRELSAVTRKQLEEIKSRSLATKIEETKVEKKKSLLDKLNVTHWDEIKTVAPEDLGI